MGQAFLIAGQSDFVLRNGQAVFGSISSPNTDAASYTFANIGFQPSACCIWNTFAINKTGTSSGSATRGIAIAKIIGADYDVHCSGLYSESGGYLSSYFKFGTQHTLSYNANTKAVVVSSSAGGTYNQLPWNVSGYTMYFLFLRGDCNVMATTAQGTSLRVSAPKQPLYGIAYAQKNASASDSYAFLQMCAPNRSHYYLSSPQSGYANTGHFSLTSGLTFDAASKNAIFAAPSWVAADKTYYTYA